MTSDDLPASGAAPDKGRRRPSATIDLRATEIESTPAGAHSAAQAAGSAPAQGPAASQSTVGAPEPAITSPQTGQETGNAEASVSADEPPKPTGQSEPDARASQDWRAAMTGTRVDAARRPSFPWPAAGAAVGGGLIVLIGFLLLNPGPPPNDSARVVDMRLIRVEQQVRELTDRAPSATTDPKIIEEMASRLAKLENAVAAIKPAAADPALANRIAAVEGGVKAVADQVAALGKRGDDIAAQTAEARRLADTNAAALAALDKKLVSLGPTPVVRGEFDALAGRLGAVEAALAKRPLDTPPDRPGRLAIVAEALKGAVERGEPFAAELASVKALAPDAQVIAPLEPFAASGVPTGATLARELSALAPALYAAAGTAQGESGGFLERLQVNAERLVRIRPIEEVPGNDPNTVIARIELRAAHSDLTGALAELAKLPPSVRAPAEAWIQRAQARGNAVEASRRFAADTMAALGK
jgi:hypothetical protein